MNSASNASSTLVAFEDRSSAGAALPVAAISTPPRNAVKNALRSIYASSNTVSTACDVEERQRCCRSHTVITLPEIVVGFAGNRPIAEFLAMPAFFGAIERIDPGSE